MGEMFKTIPKNDGIKLTSSEKNQRLITDIGGGWYLEKCKKKLPPLKRTKLGKKAQDHADLIKNELFRSNMLWNDWKFQLHWNRLEWVNPRSTPKRVKPFSVSSKKFYINNNDRKAHFVGHSQLGPLDYADFYERKNVNENMENEMKEIEEKIVEKPYKDDVNYDEAIPLQIRKERTTEAYKDNMDKDIETVEKNDNSKTIVQNKN